MIAEYETECYYCGEPIEEGDEIENDEEWGWVHAECQEAIDEGP